jgi:predicted GIY-YIG superfamily endonuclease
MYVGVTVDVNSRMFAHRLTRAFFAYVSRIELVAYSSREKAEAAESWAIKTEKPIYNVQHSSLSELERKTAIATLENLGHRAITAASEEDALAVYAWALQDAPGEDLANFEKLSRRLELAVNAASFLDDKEIERSLQTLGSRAVMALMNSLVTTAKSKEKEEA